MLKRKRSKSFIVAILLICSLFAYPQQILANSDKDVVISEVAWMGTSTSYNDEWIELYNNTGSAINLSGWTLKATDNQPSINLTGTIPAHGYFLLERTDDTSVSGVAADLIYTGTLENGGEVLELRDNTNTLIDVVGSGAWYAGNNSSKATMERINKMTSGTNSSNWATATASYAGGYGTPLNSSVTGGGSWTPGTLEIHHINVGQGDATLVVSPSGKSILFDAGESYWNSSADAQVVGPYIEAVLGQKKLDYVLISHFHLDHIGYVGKGGLWHLVEQQNFTIGKMIHRDYTNYLGTTSGTFNNWKTYLEGAGNSKLNPEIAVEGTSQVNLGGGVLINILVIDGNGAMISGDFSGNPIPPSENDFSIGVNVSYGDFDEWIGGDLSGQYAVSSFNYSYHDIELSAAKDVGDVDVYRVNHHGSDHSSSATFVNQLDPEVSIISVGDGNTYGHPRQGVMDLILPTSDVYLTERGDTTTNIGNATVAGHIVIKTTNGTHYTVNGNSYIATEPVRTDNDGDGYFVEVDPDDNNSQIIPAANGGVDPMYQN